MLQVSDLSIHDSIAVFTSILIARQCITLEDFVLHVAVHSLLAVGESLTSGSAACAHVSVSSMSRPQMLPV